MTDLSQPSSVSINSIDEGVDALQEDSELEASSVESIQLEQDESGSYKEKINLNEITSNKTVENGEKSKMPFRKMYFVALAALMNALCMGYSGTYTATANTDMKRHGSLVRPSEDQRGWIGSFLPLGALFGGMAAGNLSQSLGRKGALLLSSIPFTAGWLFIAYATSIEYIYVGRGIIGFCCGIVSVTTPMYLVEISTPEVRGLLGASFQLFVTVGILLVACVGSLLQWTWLAVTGACISVQTMILILFIPESPRWLMSKNKRDKALWSIDYLQGTFLDSEEECKSIQDSIAKQPKGSFQFSELKYPDAYKPAIISFCLMFFQQFSGVNAILFYTGEIFLKAGSSIAPNLCTIIIALMQMISTAISSILMDKAGRKILLLVSGGVMSVSLCIFGAFDMYASKQNKETEIRIQYGWISLVSLTAFICAFSLGFGPIPWLMVSEMTTPRLRSATSGVATALNWTFAFVVTNTYASLSSALHGYGVYFFYAGICGASCFFTYFCVPETKGKDMEEIRLWFLPKRHRKSVRLSQHVSEMIRQT